MRSIVLGAALLAALTAAAPPLLAHEPVAKSSQANALAAVARPAAAIVDAFHAALRRGDTKAAAALLSDQVLIFEGGGVERSKAEYAAHHLGADAEFSRAVPSRITRRAGDSDGTTAWIASEGRMSGSFNGRPVDQLTAETMVLRRTGRAWKITHIHWSSAATKP